MPGLDGPAMRGLFANPKTGTDAVTVDNGLTVVVGSGGTGGRNDGVIAGECEDGRGG